MSGTRYAGKARLVTEEVEKVIAGKQSCVEKIMMAFLAGGHILIEDIPGVGKTTLAVAFARAMSLDQGRVQFTPVVMPSDITGFSMYDKEDGRFHYHPGAVMCNLFLADEINRTSARTQAALLQVMEEGTVTVDGVTYPVPEPFQVIATENPIGSVGTQMLPESQLDRFMICVVMGYPSRKDEIEILTGNAGYPSLREMRAVVTADELVRMQAETREVFIHKVIYDYIVSLAEATRDHPMLALGLSPRGSLAAVQMAKAAAYMDGRTFAVPDDVAHVFGDIARHRVILNAQAKASRVSADDVLAEILESVKKPRPEKRQK